MISRQTLDEQNFIIGAIGGTLVPNSTHRSQDILVGLLDGMVALRAAAVRDLRSNLAGEILGAFATLADMFPESITDEGSVTDAVAEQAAALVGDPDVIERLGLSDAVSATWERFDLILGRGDCYVCGEDGVGVYAIEASDYDD